MWQNDSFYVEAGEFHNWYYEAKYTWYASAKFKDQ